MRLHVRHETAYAYERPVPRATHLLRLSPREHAGLRVVSWEVASDHGGVGACRLDGFGNTTHLHRVSDEHARLVFVAEGVIETRDRAGLAGGAREPLPASFFLRTTRRTTPSPALAALAAEAAERADPLVRLHRLLTLIHARLASRSGGTVNATAAEAWATGAGGAQDHAHVFVTAARLLGLPARCVGGHLGAENAHGAGHAWAEAHHPDLGWIAFDAANGVCAGERLVAFAVGLDHDDTAPVRGFRGAPAGTDSTPRAAMAQTQAQQ